MINSLKLFGACLVIGLVVVITAWVGVILWNAGGIGALVMFGFPIAMLGLSFAVVVAIGTIEELA